MMSFLPGTRIRLTTVAAQSSMRFLGGLKTWSSVQFYLSAFVLATGAVIVNAYEWHQDVLYGLPT